MRLHRTILVCILVLAGALVGASPSSAADKCYTIDAKGSGFATGPTTTTATITGGRFLNGSTTGEFDQPIGDFTGTVQFATNGKDTLVVSVTGNLDPGTLMFHADGVVDTGTGKLQGATGSLTFDGRITDPAAGAFVETVTGTVCLPK